MATKLIPGSLETQLIVVMLLLAILPSAAVGWTAYNVMMEYIRSDHLDTVGRVADSKRTQLVMVLQRQNDRAKSFLSNLVTQCGHNAAERDSACAADLLKSYLASEKALGGSLHTQRVGEGLIIGASAARNGRNTALQAGQLAQFSATGPGKNVSYFISVADPAGFELMITYPSSILDPVFASPPAELGASGETFLADGEGYFVTTPKFSSTQGHSHPISARPMQSCLNRQDREVIDEDYRDVSTIMGFRFIPEFGSACIMAHHSEEEAFAPVKSLERRMIIAMLIFGLILIAACVYIAKGIVRPLTNLTKVARAIGAGNYKAKAEAGGTDEIAELAASFNFMTSELYEQSALLEDQVRERTKELEQTQHETATLLHRNQALMKNSLDAIAIMDAQANIVEANDAFCRKLGYTREEIAGLNAADWEAQPPEELRARFKNLIGKSAMFETLWRRKDGTMMDVEVSASGVEVEGQRLVFASARDITARKRAEAVLRQHKVVLDTSIDGFWVTDMKGNLLEVNQAYANMSGYPLEDLVNMHISQLEAKEQSIEEVSAHIAKIMAQGYDRFETLHRCKDGHEIDIEVSVTYMEESQQMFAFCRDITARKQAEAQMAETLSLLQTTNKALDEFTYIAAHDLKEPLRGIHNYTSFLKEDYSDQLDENAQQYISSIQRLSERLSALIDRLLAYSRLGSTELAKIPVDVDLVVDAVVEDLSRFWRDQAQGGMGVELRRNGSLGTVQGDATHIGEVFQNLISNAAKYNDKPEKWIEIGCDRSGVTPVFYVRDNGIGIQPHHQDSVFRIFKRLHEQNKYGGGTGAGLTITKKIIELHGGRIWLESIPGEGTTFYFTLNEDA